MLATIREARNAGYRIEVHYTCVGSAEQALDRIRTRVAQGGHDIPEEDAKRRFARSLEQLPEVMIEANETYLYDNSIRHAPHRQVAVIGVGMGWAAAEVPDWAANAIQKATDRSRNDGESEEYARRSDRALRIHDARSRHSEPSVRADAHVHIAGLTPDADTAAQKLREAVNSDLTIRNESSLNRRLMAIATEIEGGGRSDRRDDAIKAAESKETRSEAREAALRRPPWETASGGDEPSREPTERPPRRRKPQERER